MELFVHSQTSTPNSNNHHARIAVDMKYFQTWFVPVPWTRVFSVYLLYNNLLSLWNILFGCFWQKLCIWCIPSYEILVSYTCNDLLFMICCKYKTVWLTGIVYSLASTHWGLLAYLWIQNGVSIAQEMTCRWFKGMLSYCQLHTRARASVRFESKYNTYSWIIWENHL